MSRRVTEETRAAALATRTRRRAAIHKESERLRQERGCADCGTHEAPLEWHHTEPRENDPKTKRAVSRTVTWAAFHREVALSIVLCKQCHLARHRVRPTCPLCDRPARQRSGLCSMHYKRWWRRNRRTNKGP